MSNRMTIYGHLGKDVEIKDVNGKRIMVLSVASNHKIKGEEITVWRKVTFWEDNYRKIEPYLTKGASVQVYGEELPPSIYQSNSGHAVSLEMTGKDVMFSPFSKGSKEGESSSKGSPSAHKIVDYIPHPAEEEDLLPGMPPC